MVPVARAYALTAASYLLPLCDGEKLEPKFAGFFLNYQEHASRFPHLAEQLSRALSAGPPLNHLVPASLNARKRDRLFHATRLHMFDLMLRLDLLSPSLAACL